VTFSSCAPSPYRTGADAVKGAAATPARHQRATPTMSKKPSTCTARPPIQRSQPAIAPKRAAAGQRLVGAAGRMLMSQFFSALEAEVDRPASA
jgi:hypothetical protein